MIGEAMSTLFSPRVTALLIVLCIVGLVLFGIAETARLISGLDRWRRQRMIDRLELDSLRTERQLQQATRDAVDQIDKRASGRHPQ